MGEDGVGFESRRKVTFNLFLLSYYIQDKLNTITRYKTELQYPDIYRSFQLLADFMCFFPDCKDDPNYADECPNKAAISGYCDAHYDFMYKNCRKSCSFCSVGEFPAMFLRLLQTLIYAKSMNVCMLPYMNGWTDGRTDGRTDVRMDV